MDHIEFMRAWVASRDWRASTTMPHLPHEYTVIKYRADEEETGGQGAQAVATIRERGDYFMFGRNPVPYLVVDGHEYWVMPGGDGITECVNRQTLAQRDALIAQRPRKRAD